MRAMMFEDSVSDTLRPAWSVEKTALGLEVSVSLTLNDGWALKNKYIVHPSLLTDANNPEFALDASLGAAIRKLAAVLVAVIGPGLKADIVRALKEGE